LFLILFIALISNNITGQLQGPLSYRTTVRNSAGEPVVSRTVYFRLSILMGEGPGTPVYSEFHKVTTGSDGSVTLYIGEGTDKNGDFSSIPWDSDKFFLKVETDIAGGSAFVEMITTQLLVVPVQASEIRSEKSSVIIEEDELVIVRKYAGTFLEYRHTGSVSSGEPNLIWIKTSMENIFGKISAYGRICDFTAGDNLYLKRTYYSPGVISGYWVYQIENNSSVSYRLTEFQHDKKVLVENWF
jgi:hypothetical protein